jgi:hypothetical protein|nr:MAG TPA: hypothetical protein [Caudoviricetes sp.]
MEEEKKVTFDTSERMTYGAMNYDGTEMMAVISGYDLNIAFNMRTINSLSDAEAAANALSQVFYELLMEQLLEEKSYLVKPPPEKTPIP